ncbi:retrovirus-related Pol polyprotein from transposon 17.6 [Trichonephila clavipes]|nr:retrovirus-related Pol polyprotein from transposon 17.6 [Trichonephila clavipes]
MGSSVRKGDTGERISARMPYRVKWDTVVTKSVSETALHRNFQKLMPKFNLKNDDISLFLEIFERQAKVLQFSKDQWVTYLIGILPVEVNNIIAREPEKQASDCEHIKEVLLKRFKLSMEKFRQLPVKTQKNSEATWYDFYHELKAFLDGSLNGLKIETFEQLRDLMLVDQIKRCAPNEFKEHFLDEWATITSPKNLGTHFRNHNDARNSGKTPELNFDKGKRLQCYECGSFNHLRPQCPYLKTQKVELCRIGVKSEESLLDPCASKGKVNGFRMLILRDTGATHTVDVIFQKYVDRDRMKGEQVWFRPLLDDHMTCLPVAEVDIECDLGTEGNIQSSGDKEPLGSRAVYLG